MKSLSKTSGESGSKLVTLSALEKLNWSASASHLAKVTDQSTRQVERHLRDFVDRGILQKVNTEKGRVANAYLPVFANPDIVTPLTPTSNPDITPTSTPTSGNDKKRAHAPTREGAPATFNFPVVIAKAITPDSSGQHISTHEICDEEALMADVHVPQTSLSQVACELHAREEIAGLDVVASLGDTFPQMAASFQEIHPLMGSLWLRAVFDDAKRLAPHLTVRELSDALWVARQQIALDIKSRGATIASIPGWSRTVTRSTLSGYVPPKKPDPFQNTLLVQETLAISEGQGALGEEDFGRGAARWFGLGDGR